MLRWWETLTKEEGSVKLTDVPLLGIPKKLAAIYS